MTSQNDENTRAFSWLTPSPCSPSSSSSLAWCICDTHIIYFSWFMLNSIFARIPVSFWFTTILFGRTQLCIDMVKKEANVAIDASPTFFYRHSLFESYLCHFSLSSIVWMSLYFMLISLFFFVLASTFAWQMHDIVCLSQRKTCSPNM